MGTYKRIPSSEAPRWAHMAAKDAAAEVAKILGLVDIHVQWIKRRPGERRAGWVDQDIPGVIHIAVDWAKAHDAKNVRGLIYHEGRHLWQAKNIRHYGDRKEEEEDAQRFCMQYLGFAPDILDYYQWRYT
jgi:hypothetical protein